jgi:hypothetical protein
VRAVQGLRKDNPTMPKNGEDEDIGTTLRRLARTSRSPKQLLKATLEHHPDAKKKDIAHAAFRLMIETADQDPEEAVILQDVGLAARNADA